LELAWYWGVFGIVSVEPLLPFFIVTLEGVRELSEEAVSFSTELMAGELDGIHPHGRLQIAWGLFLRFLIEITSTFQIDRNIIVSELLISDQNLEDNEQEEGGLISLIKASVDSQIDLIGRRLDDVLDSFQSGTFLGDVNSVIEYGKELCKRGIVHPFDKDHFNDTEVQDGSSDGSGSVLLSLCVNLLGLLLGNGKKIGDFFGRSLGLIEHLNQLGILNEVTSGGGQLQKKFLVKG
jgi:hypothetical protein